MTTQAKSEACRICGGDLQGNQRRWLYGGQNRKGGQPQTPTDSVRKGSLPRSTSSSPWGSTLSLGSSVSVSKFSTLPSPGKGMDLLSVLTHILGQAVPRGNGQGEFLCGKCVSVLERVFKFDTVIARVRVLSTERLQKLTQERNKIRHWVLNVYRQHHPNTIRMRQGSSEDDGGEMGEVEGDAEEGYKEMLRGNMAFSEYEFWSDKSSSCPYFQQTGKRCKGGKNCEGCNTLRVSDSDYESACGVPRHVPAHAVTPFALSRDKSRSMPLHWSRVPSISHSSTSLTSSCHSLHGRSRTNSIQSVDSEDGRDAFDWLEEQHVAFGSILKQLKGIETKPVHSPNGSRIPVLGARNGQNGGEVAADSPKTAIIRALNFGEEDGEEEDGVDGESEDVLTELRDEFLPLHREVSTGRAHLAIRQLREQLDQAQARIRTLEAKLKDETKPVAKHSRQHKAPPAKSQANTENGGDLMLNMSQSLHSREKIIQECVRMISKLCVAGPVETDKLNNTLMDSLMTAHTEIEAVVEAQLAELREREQSLEREMEALRKAGREREGDLSTLNTVLQCNQDVINDLRNELAMGEREKKELQKELEGWKTRDQTLAAVLREKEAFVLRLKEALESTQRDVQALSDSVIGQGVSGGGADADLANRLREKEALLAACLKEREELGATICQEVSKLSATLKDTQAMIQDQTSDHKQAVSALSGQLRDTHKELRERVKESKNAEHAWRKEKDEREAEERRLRESLQKRDKVIEQVLLDSEERDAMLTELHQNILSKLEPRTALKHTL